MSDQAKTGAIWSYLSSLFRRDAVPAGPARPSKTGEASAPLDHPQFTRRLIDLTADRAAVTAGKLHLVNLTAVRQQYAREWPRLSAHVDLIVESVLRRHLDPGDFFTKLGDGIYVVVFFRLPRADAELRCDLVSREILRRLLGDDAGAHVVGLENLAGEIATVVADVDGAAARQSADPMQVVVRTLNAKEDGRSRISTARAAKGDTRTSAGPGWTTETATDAAAVPAPIGSGHGRGASDDLARLLREANREIPEWRRSSLAQAAPTGNTTAPVPSPPASPSPVEGELVFLYQPVWDTARKAITTYLIDPRLRTEAGLVDITEALPLDNGPDGYLDFDSLLLRRGLADLAGLLASGEKAILSVPVHCSTMADAIRRSQYVRTLAELPEAMKRLLIVELVDAYVIPWSEVAQITALLRNVCRSVSLRISLDQPRFEHLVGVGVGAVGGDLRDHPWSEKQAMKHFDAFAGAAQAAGLTSYVLGLRSHSLAVAAAGAGFDHLAGAGVVPEVPALGRVRTFETINLFIRSLPARPKRST